MEDNDEPSEQRWCMPGWVVATSIMNESAPSSESTSTTQVDNSNNNAARTLPKPILQIAVGSSNPSKIKAVDQAFRRCLNRKNDNNGKVGAVVSQDVTGFDVESGVDCQPVGDAVTCEGARNRARAAYLAFKRKTGYFPHMAVGIEGGIEWIDTGARKITPKKKGSANNGENQKTRNEDSLEEENDGEGDDHFGSEKSLFCMAWVAVYGKRQATTVDVLASDDTITYFGDKKPYYGIAKAASFPLPPALSKLVTEDGMELGEADDFLFQRKNSKQGSGSVGYLTDGIIDRSAYYEHAVIVALEPWIRPDLFPSAVEKST